MMSRGETVNRENRQYNKKRLLTLYEEGIGTFMEIRLDKCC